MENIEFDIQKMNTRLIEKNKQLLNTQKFLLDRIEAIPNEKVVLFKSIDTISTGLNSIQFIIDEPDVSLNSFKQIKAIVRMLQDHIKQIK